MDANFEYLNHELIVRGFRDCVRHFMKGESYHLKKLYAKGGQWEYPIGVKRDEWNAFVQYWQGHETHKKANIMSSAKGVVHTENTYGCGGKVGAKNKLVSIMFI